MQAGERRARVQMRLAGDKQRPGEALGHMRLQRRDAVPVQPLGRGRAAGEGAQLATIPAERNDQRAILGHRSPLPGPPLGGTAPLANDLGLGARAFALGRQHAPRPPGAGVLPRPAGGIKHGHPRPARAEFRRGSQTADTAAQYRKRLVHPRMRSSMCYLLRRPEPDQVQWVRWRISASNRAV